MRTKSAPREAFPDPTMNAPAPHGIPVKQRGKRRDNHAGDDAGAEFLCTAHPVHQKFQRMIGDGQHQHHRKSALERRFDLSKRFGKCSVEARRENAKDQFGQKSSARSVKSARKIHAEEQGGSEDGAGNRGFPVPPLQKINSRLEDEAGKSGSLT